MNALSIVIAFSVAVSTSVFAEDVDQVLDRQSTLKSMEYKRDQLQLQAEMAGSYSKMREAGFIVDTEGNPLGVESMQKLGVEVRGRAGGGESNPFQAASAPGAPNSIPFMFDQPNVGGLGPGASPFVRQQRSGMPATTNSVPPVLPPLEAQGERTMSLSLKQVRGDSVVLRTSEGDRILRVGEKIRDLTLQRFSADKAYFKGPQGTQVLSIEWGFQNGMRSVAHE